jgi:AraC family transcriptional regulator
MIATALEDASLRGTVIRSELGLAMLSAYRTSSSDPRSDRLVRFGATNSYLLSVHLKSAAASTIFHGNRRLSLRPRIPMEYSLGALDGICIWSVQGTFDVVCFEFPRSAIACVGSRRLVQPIDLFGSESDATAIDQTIASFAFAMAQAIDDSSRFDQFYIDHLLEGLRAYIALKFFGIERNNAKRAGLAAWQERRAKELMAASIGTDLSLQRVAAECGLSLGHFNRAFRLSTGYSPHKWFVERRIDAALQLLSDSKAPLADVAAQCGFTDQSHLTNVFSRRVGISPGTYRRQCRISPLEAMHSGSRSPRALHTI